MSNYDDLKERVEEARNEAFNFEYDIESLLKLINDLWAEYNEVMGRF